MNTTTQSVSALQTFRTSHLDYSVKLLKKMHFAYIPSKNYQSKYSNTEFFSTNIFV